MKKIALLLFLYLSLFSLVISAEETDSSSNDNNIDYIELAFQIFQSLEKECAPDIMNTIRERSIFEKDKRFPWLTDSMGKGINDIGDEIECLNSLKNTTFFMINFHDLNLSLILDNDQKLMRFLEIHDFALGFCIFYSCREAFHRYLQILAEFINYLASNKTNDKELVSMIEDNKKDNYTTNTGNVYNDDNLETKVAKQTTSYLVITLVVIKIAGGIIRIIFVPKGYDKYVAEKINQFSHDDLEDIEEKTNLAPKNKFNEALGDESSTKGYNPLFDFSEKLPKLIRILRVFDIINDIHYLSSKRNRYYNDTGLDIIVFNRAIVIFFLIFSNTFSALIALPSEEIINSSFFKSYLNIIYRLSNNALICWAFLEGAYTTYKLLCFIQSEMFIYFHEQESKSKIFYKKLPLVLLKFLILLIPKMVTFIIVYYVFYFRIEDYRFLSNAKATFEYIIKNIFTKEINCSSPGDIFSNIFNRYIDVYNHCYEFIYFYLNMFLSTLFFMIMTYLFFIIKHKIFEIVIIALNFIFFFASIALVMDSKDEENSEVKKVLLLHYHIKGQTYSTKILFSFIGFYHLGFIIGFLIFNSNNIKQMINRLIYEYNKIHIKKLGDKKEEEKSYFNVAESSSSGRTETEQSFDIKSKADLINKEDRNSPNYYELPYYPLKYLERLLKSISKLRFGIKIGLVIGGIALLFLIDLILLIYIFNTDNGFEIVFTKSAKFIFRYEKHFFMVVYFFIIIIMITLPKKGALRNFMNSKIIICISRIGFLITCVSHVFTYFSFLIFSLKVKLYVPTFMIISFGNFLLFFIICIFLCTVSEIPLRMIIKKLLRINRRKDSIIL